MNKGKGQIKKRFGGKRPAGEGPGKPRDKEKEHLHLDKLLAEHNAKTGGNTEIYNKRKQDNLNEELKKFMEAQPSDAAALNKKPSEKQAEDAPEKAEEEPAAQALEVTKKRSSVTKREVTQTK